MRFWLDGGGGRWYYWVPRCGVEQWQLVGLITRRSVVRIHSPLLRVNQSPSGSGFSLARRTAVDIFPKMEEFLMNRSTPGSTKQNSSLSLVKSIDGFLKFKTAEGLSQRTITSYEYMLNHWLKYIGDRSVSEIQASDLTGYMAWLRTEYKPVRFNGSKELLSAKSIRNVWVTFRSFFGWLQGDLIPQGAELLSIAGLFGTKVYSLLGQPEPDPELVKIYKSFSHLTGENKGKLAHALWEAQAEMSQKGVTVRSEESKSILSQVFKKWGFETPNNN